MSLIVPSSIFSTFSSSHVAFKTAPHTVLPTAQRVSNGFKTIFQTSERIFTAPFQAFLRKVQTFSQVGAFSSYES
jgi:hypothetical protein